MLVYGVSILFHKDPIIPILFDIVPILFDIIPVLFDTIPMFTVFETVSMFDIVPTVGTLFEIMRFVKCVAMFFYGCLVVVFFTDCREQLKIPRLLINNHKSFIRVVEITATKKTLLEGNQDFVFLENTSDKFRYSTLKLQELNAKMKALHDEHEKVQRALSKDLCNQVQVMW